MKRIILFGLLSLGLLVSLNSNLVAADYPKKPVKLIINFSAGGTTDTAARLMVSKAAEIVGQALVCMNKPGAGGTLGVSHVARAKNDGYTIGTCNMPAVAIIPQIREVPYKPFEDLTQIAAEKSRQNHIRKSRHRYYEPSGYGSYRKGARSRLEACSVPRWCQGNSGFAGRSCGLH